jgi:hypothetical protein
LVLQLLAPATRQFNGGRLAAMDLIAPLAPLDRSRGRHQLCDVAQQDALKRLMS